MVGKKYLLIVPFASLPRDSGGRERVWHTIQYLADRFDLTVWSFAKDRNEADHEARWFKKLRINYRHFIYNSVRHTSRFQFIPQPFWFKPWWSSELIHALRQITEDEYDQVEVDGTQLLYAGKYLPKKTDKIFVAYDVSTISFWRRLREESNLLKKILHCWRLMEIFIYERLLLPRFNRTVAVSKTDAGWLSRLFQLQNVEIVPNGIDKLDPLALPPKSDTVRLGFIGAFDHPPNLHAARFIIQRILPKLEENGIDYELFMAGNQDPTIIKTMAKGASVALNKIHILGFVKQSKSFYKEIDFLLAPIFSGSGTRIKILESLSFFRPVLTTKVGAEGIDMGKPFLITISPAREKDSQEWLKMILNVKNLSEDISKNQTQRLKENLKNLLWDEVFKPFYSKYRN